MDTFREKIRRVRLKADTKSAGPPEGGHYVGSHGNSSGQLACNELAITECPLNDDYRSLDKVVWHRAAVNNAQGFTLPYEVKTPAMFTRVRFLPHNTVNTHSLSLPLASVADDLIRVAVGGHTISEQGDRQDGCQTNCRQRCGPSCPTGSSRHTASAMDCSAEQAAASCSQFDKAIRSQIERLRSLRDLRGLRGLRFSAAPGALAPSHFGQR